MNDIYLGGHLDALDDGDRTEARKEVNVVIRHAVRRAVLRAVDLGLQLLSDGGERV